MCFSAKASFVSSVVLMGIGVASISKANKPGERLLACVPIFFCIQQLIEGFVWLSLQTTEYHYLEKIATYGFLLFAQVIWPSMVPVTVWANETDEKKKKPLSYLMAIGIFISSLLLVFLFLYPVQATIMGRHVKYNVDFPMSDTLISGVIYLIPTLMSPFLSSIKPLRWLGALLALSFIITSLLYREYLISVWCYFASLISALTFYIIYYMQHPGKSAMAMSH